MKVNAYIPASYIVDEVERLDIYKKIASIQGDKDYYDVQEELEIAMAHCQTVFRTLLTLHLLSGKLIRLIFFWFQK